jgi:hypothetical protein
MPSGLWDERSCPGGFFMERRTLHCDRVSEKETLLIKNGNVIFRKIRQSVLIVQGEKV